MDDALIKRVEDALSGKRVRLNRALDAAVQRALFSRGQHDQFRTLCELLVEECAKRYYGNISFNVSLGPSGDPECPTRVQIWDDQDEYIFTF